MVLDLVNSFLLIHSKFKSFLVPHMLRMYIVGTQMGTVSFINVSILLSKDIVEEVVVLDCECTMLESYVILLIPLV